MTNLANALNVLKPAVADDYAKLVTQTITNIFETHGTDERQLSNKLSHSWSADGYRWRNIRHLTTKVDPAMNSFFDGELKIDEERVAKQAARYADETIAKFVAKLTAKLSDLDSIIEVMVRPNTTEFRVRGKFRGQLVTVEQHRIINWSSKGKPFHQFPARIYVGEKRYSEAAFKKLAK